jgi:prolipoprotein diacylglyceryltransferase
MYYFSKIYYKTVLWILDRVVRLLVELFFVRLGNFFNSEIIGKETNSTFGIKFIRDQFSPRDAVNATQISNPLPSYCKQSTICQFTGTSSGQASCSVV